MVLEENMVLKQEIQWLEKQITLQCAPLLAGLKPSNLLILPTGMEEALIAALKKTGVAVYCLSEQAGKEVYLLYKVNELIVYLTEEPVQKLLWELGYTGIGLFSFLQRVSEKYTAHLQEKTAFPHELGLLLGYPVVDVRGFMEHNGKNYHYSGYWKVYGNVQETVRLFGKFGKAKKMAVQWLEKGYSIADIMALYHNARAIA